MNTNKDSSQPQVKLERLQKVICRWGTPSRRQAESLISEGRVRVNGVIVKELGTLVDPSKDTIHVSGKRLKRRYSETWMMYKPRGFLCTRADEVGRPTVYDLLPRKISRLGLKTVGRLDGDSLGLLLFTNDGDLSQRLTHPRHHVPKLYEVKIRGRLSSGDVRRFEKGVFMHTEGYRAKPAKVRVTRELPNSSWIEVELDEGRNRQIRHMCESLGHQVSKLKRVAVGPLKLRHLKMGEVRPLTPQEQERLYRSVGLIS